MISAVRAVYSRKLASRGQALQDCIVDTWLLGDKTLSKQLRMEDLVALYAEAPDLAADLTMKALATTAKSDNIRGKCTECGLWSNLTTSPLRGFMKFCCTTNGCTRKLAVQLEIC